MKHRPIALALVAMGTIHATAWKLGPIAVDAEVWNATGAVFTAVLLIWLGALYSSASVWLAVALTAGAEIQTATCSMAYIIRPWVMAPGDDLCSAGLGFPVFFISLWALVCLAIYIRGTP